MQRLLIAFVALGSAACAHGPAPNSPEEIDSLIRTMDKPESRARLAAIGDSALPALAKAITSPPGPRPDQAIRVLEMMWKKGRTAALDAYLEAVRKTPDDPAARRLLGHAHRFQDPEGRVFRVLEAALQNMRVVSPDMVASAAAMSSVEALETLMQVVADSVDTPDASTRALAMRYIGRAARRGRLEATSFLTMCTQSTNADVAIKAGAELRLIAGRDAPKGWRAWWFEHSGGDRKAWLAASFAPVGGKPFDPGHRDHLAELVKRIPADADAEPELWYLEQAVGRSFGYVSPRDVFDPDVDAKELAASNLRAVGMAREWWNENAPYLYFNSSTGRYDVNEEGRRIGVPVDPKTGKPGGSQK